MMASKARLFNDAEIRAQILVAPDPKTAKAIGRLVSGFDDEVWRANARRLVVEGNVHKFQQNSTMRDILLATGNAVIVEASPRDCIWGIGLGQDNPKAHNPETWRGKNLLGFALMDVRENFQGTCT